MGIPLVSKEIQERAHEDLETEGYEVQHNSLNTVAEHGLFFESVTQSAHL